MQNARESGIDSPQDKHYDHELSWKDNGRTKLKRRKLVSNGRKEVEHTVYNLELEPKIIEQRKHDFYNQLVRMGS